MDKADISLKQIMYLLTSATIEALLGVWILAFWGALYNLFVNLAVTIEAILGLVSIGCAILTFIVVLFGWRLEATAQDGRFKHLSLFYSPEFPEPIEGKEVPIYPRYIVNNNSCEAYRVSGILKPYIKKIESRHAYGDEKSILQFFKSQNITPVPKALSFDAIDLWLKPNGFLVRAEAKLTDKQIDALQKQFDEGKLKKYQLIYLNPWYCWFRLPFLDKLAYPPSKRIIANTITGEVYYAPKTTLDLEKHGFLVHQTHSPRPHWSIDKWCDKKRKWQKPIRGLTEEELAGNYES